MLSVGQKIRAVRLATTADLDGDVPHPMRRYVAVYEDHLSGWAIADRLTERLLMRGEIEALPDDFILQEFGSTPTRPV